MPTVHNYTLSIIYNILLTIISGYFTLYINSTQIVRKGNITS